MLCLGGWVSAVGIANRYGLDGSGFEPVANEFYRTRSAGPEAHLAFCRVGTVCQADGVTTTAVLA